MEKPLKQFEKFGETAIQDLSLNIFFTNYWLLEKYNSILKKFNLKYYKQYYVLKLLNDSKVQMVTMVSLQEYFFDKKINFSRLIDSLYVIGLVNRIQSESDRRSVELSITLKGKTVLKQIDHLLSKIEYTTNDENQIEMQKLNAMLNNFRSQKKRI